jgi:hypothetical protein
MNADSKLAFYLVMRSMLLKHKDLPFSERHKHEWVAWLDKRIKRLSNS